MIAELTAERDRLDHAILALERLSHGPQSKRGRPPKWLRDLNSLDPQTRADAVEMAKSHSNGKK